MRDSVNIFIYMKRKNKKKNREEWALGTQCCSLRLPVLWVGIVYVKVYSSLFSFVSLTN